MTTTASNLLPHRQLTENETLTKPVNNFYFVGNLVGIYSRGSGRVARVSKVFPTRLEVEYTTEGALRDAAKQLERDILVSPREARDRAIAAAEKNWDFARSQLEGNTPNWRWGYDLTPEQRARYEAEVAMGQAAYALQFGEESHADAVARNNKARELGPEGYAAMAHVTTKMVKIADVYGLVGEVL